MQYRQAIKENIGVEENEFVPGYSHNDGLAFDENNEMHKMMDGMSETVFKIFEPMPNKVSSILDVGSGAGSLAYFLRKQDPDVRVVTVDGNEETNRSPFIEKEDHFIVRTDQEYKIVDENNEIVKFDLIVSFEHLEHIHEDNFEQFLENIYAHSHEKTVFFGTAANWEYEAEDEKHIHCNVKNHLEWREYLKTQKGSFGVYNLAPLARLFNDELTEKDLEDAIKLFTCFPRFAQVIFEGLVGHYPNSLPWTHRLFNSSIIFGEYFSDENATEDR
jgi:SAM-dependent methyltransferase